MCIPGSAYNNYVSWKFSATKGSTVTINYSEVPIVDTLQHYWVRLVLCRQSQVFTQILSENSNITEPPTRWRPYKLFWLMLVKQYNFLFHYRVFPEKRVRCQVTPITSKYTQSIFRSPVGNTLTKKIRNLKNEFRPKVKVDTAIKPFQWFYSEKSWNIELYTEYTGNVTRVTLDKSLSISYICDCGCPIRYSEIDNWPASK